MDVGGAGVGFIVVGLTPGVGIGELTGVAGATAGDAVAETGLASTGTGVGSTGAGVEDATGLKRAEAAKGLLKGAIGLTPPKSKGAGVEVGAGLR